MGDDVLKIIKTLKIVNRSENVSNNFNQNCVKFTKPLESKQKILWYRSHTQACSPIRNVVLSNQHWFLQMYSCSINYANECATIMPCLRNLYRLILWSCMWNVAKYGRLSPFALSTRVNAVISSCSTIFECIIYWFGIKLPILWLFFTHLNKNCFDSLRDVTT